MKCIGILSDTHSYWDNRYAKYFAGCDEIWHAGDIGSTELIEKLQEIAPVRAVYGNIDGQELRLQFPEINLFEIEGIKVLMKHIGGYPGKYDKSVLPAILEHQPLLFVAGHSHILKVKFDARLNLLHVNPGAAGKYGFHKIRTLIRLKLDQGNISDLEVIELHD